MAAKYTLNLEALQAAAAKAGDLRKDGRLHLAKISRRSGVDSGVLSRITRGKNGPTLTTLGQLASAYRLRVDRLINTD